MNARSYRGGMREKIEANWRNISKKSDSVTFVENECTYMMKKSKTASTEKLCFVCRKESINIASFSFSFSLLHLPFLFYEKSSLFHITQNNIAAHRIASSLQQQRALTCIRKQSHLYFLFTRPITKESSVNGMLRCGTHQGFRTWSGSGAGPEDLCSENNQVGVMRVASTYFHISTSQRLCVASNRFTFKCTFPWQFFSS